MEIIKAGERIDDLQYKGLRIIQNPASFCFGTDAVLLASFAVIRKNDRVVDFCTGTGAIPLLLSGREKAATIRGIEIQPEMADMAKRSVTLNGLNDLIGIVNGDVRDALSLVGGVWDVVTVNPPYGKAGAGETGGHDPVRLARHEVLCGIADIVQSAEKILKNGGRFFIIFRPSRLAELFWAMTACGIEPKRMRTVHPTYGRAPGHVLVEGVKHAKKGLAILPPLYLHDENGAYTQETRRIYHRT